MSRASKVQEYADLCDRHIAALTLDGELNVQKNRAMFRLLQLNNGAAAGQNVQSPVLFPGSMVQRCTYCALEETRLLVMSAPAAPAGKRYVPYQLSMSPRTP